MDFLKIGFQMVQFFNAVALAIANHFRTGPIKIGTSLFGFQMKAICPDFKWLASGFLIPFDIQTSSPDFISLQFFFLDDVNMHILPAFASMLFCLVYVSGS